jgi:hypothetical protein
VGSFKQGLRARVEPPGKSWPGNSLEELPLAGKIQLPMSRIIPPRRWPITHHRLSSVFIVINQYQSLAESPSAWRIHLGPIARLARNTNEYFILEKDRIPLIGIMVASELKDHLLKRDPTVKAAIGASRQELFIARSRTRPEACTGPAADPD